MARNETELVKALMKRIESEYRGRAIKVHGSPLGHTGEPDIDACVRGRCVKIEVKMPGRGADSEPTPVQMGKLRKWEKVGALAGYVRSVEELDALLEHVDDFEWRNPQLVSGAAPIEV